MGPSRLFQTPIPARGRPRGKKVTPSCPPAEISLGNVIQNSRPPAGIFPGPARARPPAGKKRDGLRPGPTGRPRICRKNRSLLERMTIFEKLRFWHPGPPKSASGPSFSESPRQTISDSEVLVQIRALGTPVVAIRRYTCIHTRDKKPTQGLT